MPATTAGYSSTVKPTTFTILRVSGRCAASHGKPLASDDLESRVRQSDRVDHAAGELGDPRRGGAMPRLERHGLRDQAAEPLGTHHPVELLAVAGRPGGEDDRILKYEIVTTVRSAAPRVTATCPSPRRS